MATVIVDVLVERLITLALDKIQREMNLVTGVRQEIEKVTKKLKAIQAVMEDAEQRQVMEASVKLWLDELNDVAFDMDHVLDEWITRVLIHQQKKQEDEDSLETTFTKKVCFPCSSSCFRFRFGKVDYQLFLRHEIAHKIEELNKRLASIDLNKQSFTLANIPRVAPDLVNRPKTTSLPNAKTFGRDSEKELIISKLLSKGREKNVVVPLIIPIVGLGGVGKTTLANLVYNDDRIKSHFEKSVWVCISDPFEEIKIARAIVEGLDKYNPLVKSDELEALLKEISELIKGKKFLLVLDDIWSPNYKQWEELSKPLCQGARGSRVLVTTRNENVVALMKSTTQMIRLKELHESFCLSLFYYNAGLDESNVTSVSSEYFDIGLELVRKCKGLPLAANTLGRLMSTKKTIREWRAVLKSKTWDLERIQEDVFRPLMLSYQNLDPAVKRCLLYCVLFPKDHKYENTSLIEFWMSQDYLNAHGSEESLIVGQSYFDELAKLSFFQDLEVDDEKIRCKIHDIVHDFLQYLTKNECLILGDSEMEVQHEKVRHLVITYENDTKSLVSILSKCKKLRTCFLSLRNDENVDSVSPVVESIQGVRTLTMLGSWKDGIPETISRLIHLRYLNLSDNKELVELPKRAMGSLYNLQTLVLVKCLGLKRVYVRRLVNLRHLHNEGCLLLGLIEGLEELSQLQTLDELRVIVSDGNKLESLTDMNQLQGHLHIYIEDKIREKNTRAIVANKAHLSSLCLTFNLEGESEETHEELMNWLEPHPDLNSLVIRLYKGNRFPDWLLSLHSLTFLKLEMCKISEISPIGKLKSLETLQMYWLEGLERIGVEILGIEEAATNFISFPKLKNLYILEVDGLKTWEGVKEEDDMYNKITIMPCLTHLSILYCEDIKAVPDFLWETPLQNLDFKGSPNLVDLFSREDKQWSKISHIPNTRLRY